MTGTRQSKSQASTVAGKLRDFAADIDVIVGALTGDNEILTPERAAEILAEIAADLRAVIREISP